LKPKKSKIPWTEEEDIKLLQMWDVEGSGVQGATKENEEIDTGRRHEAQRLYWK
jgi:hypothetical protein